MTVSPVGQGKVFLVNILFGMLCVILFDLFWVLRKKWGKTIVIINILDGVYFLIAFLVILFAGVKFNFGALRYYQIIGLLTGAAIQSFFSLFARKILEKAYDIALRIIRIVLKGIIKPCVFLLQLVLSPIVYIEDVIMRLSGKINRKYKKVKAKGAKKKKTVKKRIKMI